VQHSEGPRYGAKVSVICGRSRITAGREPELQCQAYVGVESPDQTAINRKLASMQIYANQLKCYTTINVRLHNKVNMIHLTPEYFNKRKRVVKRSTIKTFSLLFLNIKNVPGHYV